VKGGSAKQESEVGLWFSLGFSLVFSLGYPGVDCVCEVVVLQAVHEGQVAYRPLPALVNFRLV
jgi:hypothetical protein